MPLKKGKGKKVQSENIAEMVDSYKKTRKIGTTKPKNKKAAVKQAVAISYKQKRGR